MEVSQYLYDAFFSNQAPAASDYFQSRAPSCFTSEEGQVQVCICCGNGAPPRSKPEPAAPELHLLKDFASPMSLELLDIHSAEELADFTDVTTAASSRKREADNVAAFATRVHDFVGLLLIQCEKMAKTSHSFIEQRSSRSRLNISLGCFTTLLDAYQVPKQLLNFICCFGLRSGETELSPPPMLFRWHLAEANRHFGKNEKVRST